jgi:hypothetical protein
LPPHDALLCQGLTRRTSFPGRQRQRRSRAKSSTKWREAFPRRGWLSRMLPRRSRTR